LVDAFHVPKLLSQPLLPFGRSGDGLGVLTFGVEQFSVLFVPGGRSTRAWRTVRAHSVLRVLARLRFRSVLVSSFGWKWFRTVRNSGRTVRGCLADSLRAPRGRSVFRGSLLEVLLALTESPRPMLDGPSYQCGQSAVHWRTVRVARADSPPLLAGRSARAWLLFSLVRFLPPSFVLPHVLQGIVPKT
jgi:hypothetical protein